MFGQLDQIYGIYSRDGQDGWSWNLLQIPPPPQATTARNLPLPRLETWKGKRREVSLIPRQRGGRTVQVQSTWSGGHVDEELVRSSRFFPLLDLSSRSLTPARSRRHLKQ